MGTKTADEAVHENGTEAKRDDATADVKDVEGVKGNKDVQDVTGAGEPTEAAAGEQAEDSAGDQEDDLLAAEDDIQAAADENERGASGVGQGAAAVVSAGLGVVSLTGSWVSTVAAARETLVGQLQTSSTASVATQVKEVYGDAWHVTAVIGGLFALLALIIGAAALARPAFGVPGRPQAAWIKSVAWAGVSLGVIGLLLAVAKYSDILLGMPSTG
ncbi:hypothetical protein [Streptomyces sp. NPDC059786]|uniref:hypothetical protein n=1 Tax=Streptomyces sp. NPDC059786 TaxID=3346946 RepID=UPI0036541FCE